MNAKANLEQGTSLRVFVDPDHTETVMDKIKGTKHVFGAIYETYSRNKIDYSSTIYAIHRMVDKYHAGLPAKMINNKRVISESLRVKPPYVSTAKEVYGIYMRCYEGNRPKGAAQIGDSRTMRVGDKQIECPQLLLNVDYLRQMLGYKANESINSHIRWLTKANILWHSEDIDGYRRLKGRYSSVFTLNATCIQHL